LYKVRCATLYASVCHPINFKAEFDAREIPGNKGRGVQHGRTANPARFAEAPLSERQYCAHLFAFVHVFHLPATTAAK
jgi:hypothetical protein